MYQEKKLQDEIQQLNAELKEQGAYMEGRKREAGELESLISKSRGDFNHFKAQRDKLQDQRKYDRVFVALFRKSVLIPYHL